MAGSSVKITYRWYYGCLGCGHFGFTHYSWCEVPNFVIRMAWLCTCCQTLYVDQCPCSAGNT